MSTTTQTIADIYRTGRELRLAGTDEMAIRSNLDAHLYTNVIYDARKATMATAEWQALADRKDAGEFTRAEFSALVAEIMAPIETRIYDETIASL